MRTATFFAFAVAAVLTAPADAQQTDANKGIKTENSGASGYVGDQDKPGSAAHVPGASHTKNGADAASATSGASSGTGIAGAPGGKNGPANQGTVGQNLSVQEQDSSNIKGLPGNKSGPPAKR
jgi:hypothetical protein